MPTKEQEKKYETLNGDLSYCRHNGSNEGLRYRAEARAAYGAVVSAQIQLEILKTLDRLADSVEALVIKLEVTK